MRDSAPAPVEHVVTIRTTTRATGRFLMRATCTCGWSDHRSWLWPDQLKEQSARFAEHAEESA